MQAKKSCPFIHVASASSLRRLTTTGSNQAMSPLMTKAKQCPIMSQAIQSRSISTSNVVAQATPSKPVKASAGKFPTCCHEKCGDPYI